MKNYTFVRLSEDIKYRLKLVTIWDIERVRSYCIKHNYCDKANCEQYDQMLGFVAVSPCIERNIVNVANFIYEHSSEFDTFRYSGYKKENLLELINEMRTEATLSYYIDIDEDDEEE